MSLNSLVEYLFRAGNLGSVLIQHFVSIVIATLLLPKVCDDFCDGRGENRLIT